MALNLKDTTLQECLEKTGLVKLPKKIDKNYKKKWIKAICLVKKSNGTENYCLCYNNGNDKPNIKQDFGPAAIITEFLGIYPYEVIEQNDIPVLRTDKATLRFLVNSGYSSKEIQQLQSKEGKTDEQIAKDAETINQYVSIASMEMAQRKSKEEERALNNRNYKYRFEDGEEK